MWTQTCPFLSSEVVRATVRQSGVSGPEVLSPADVKHVVDIVLGETIKTTLSPRMRICHVCGPKKLPTRSTEHARVFQRRSLATANCRAGTLQALSAKIYSRERMSRHLDWNSGVPDRKPKRITLISICSS